MCARGALCEFCVFVSGNVSRAVSFERTIGRRVESYISLSCPNTGNFVKRNVSTQLTQTTETTTAKNNKAKVDERKRERGRKNKLCLRFRQSVKVTRSTQISGISQFSCVWSLGCAPIIKMISCKQSILLATWLLCVFCDFAYSINHCQLHRFEKSINSTTMQFTKEAVSQEYAVSNEFKSLHCCAKGYRSIEW